MAVLHIVAVWEDWFAKRSLFVVSIIYLITTCDFSSFFSTFRLPKRPNNWLYGLPNGLQFLLSRCNHVCWCQWCRLCTWPAHCFRLAQSLFYVPKQKQTHWLRILFSVLCLRVQNLYICKPYIYVTALLTLWNTEYVLLPVKCFQSSAISLNHFMFEQCHYIPVVFHVHAKVLGSGAEIELYYM